MSGAEVAGLVLGATPLLVSALEHYEEGLSTVKVMINYRSELRNLSRRLRVEHDIFRNTLELLLSGTVDGFTIAALLNNIDGKSWSVPAIERALQSRLGDSYNSYRETVRNIDRALSEFKARLKLGQDGKAPPFHNASSFREAYKRFRFGIRKTAYLDLMERISRDNSNLAKLTEQSSALEPLRTSRGRIRDFAKVRGHASSIFVTLQKGLRESCKASHRASLYMKAVEIEGDGQSRLISYEDHDQIFRLVLHHEVRAQHQVTPSWINEEAEIRLLDSMTSAGNSASAATKNVESSEEKKTYRLRGTSVPTVALRRVTLQQQQDLDEIKDLCASIERLRLMQCGVCLGYLLGAPGTKRHGLYWPQKPLVYRSSLASLSLGTILNAQDQTQGYQLSVADSRRLAFSLAVGVLRLHDTPWLGRQWGRDDITLFKQNGSLLANHPFVSTDLQSSSPLHTSGPAMQQCLKKTAGIRNETLFALGVVLIELCLRKPLEKLSAPEDLNKNGTKHAASDFLTANRLLDDVYDTAGGHYGDATRRCILCDFDQRKANLEDDVFCRVVYDNVVAVLEEDVRHFFKL